MGRRPVGIFLRFLLAGVGIGLAVYVIMVLSNLQTSRHHPSNPPANINDSQTRGGSSFARFLSPPRKINSLIPALSVGAVIIYDIAENEIARIPAAVSESGWVAIPVQRCIGGYTWYFYPAYGDEQEIAGGIWGDRDDIGLWQFKNPNPFSGPPVFPAKPDQPMIWQSIISKNSEDLQKVTIDSEQQNFYRISFKQPVHEAGVFIQDKKIVGWTFGDLTDRGYLWKGPDESNLVYELSVNDFYRLTFQNSREEQFILAYSQKNSRPARQLDAFVKGFRRDPILFDDTTPAHLKPRAVVARMRALIAQIMDQGNPDDIASVFAGAVLARIGDGDFLTDVLTLCEQIRGPADCIGLIEDVLAVHGNLTDAQRVQIRQFRKSVYRKWLTLLMNEKEYDKGLQVYQQAADAAIDDPEIQLLGVKLALEFDDWQTAEQILYSQQFPIELTDQVRTLKSQIADLKFQEDKIVIRFPPGSSRIPVTALLNDRVQQNFVVDTGASMVTIPSATAQKLGIEIDDKTPREELVTAGGMIAAPRVTIKILQVEGWTEYNVTAYVVDMPNRAGYGLLGLNYLNRFRMDLNTRGGVLTLAPR